MHDYYTGLDQTSFSVIANFPVNRHQAGKDLARDFKEISQGVWELRLAQPIRALPSADLTVSVKDQEGNLARIFRSFTVSP